MVRFSHLLGLLIVGIFTVFISSITLADTTAVTTTTTTDNGSGTKTVVVEKRTIVTPAPGAKEIVAIPEGYASCVTVDAGWTGDVWIPAHRVCQYSNQPLGVAWVEGYWACNKYNIDSGECTNWDWKAGHWEKTLLFY